MDGFVSESCLFLGLALVLAPAALTAVILLFRRPDHPQAKREARGFPIEPFDPPPDL